jgi:uncharacterized protein
MRNEEQLQIITEIIRQECRRQSYTMKKLLLFGSRAAGNETPESDWDFLLVVSEPLTRKVRMQVWLPIDTALSRLGIAADIIIKSEADYERDRDDIGRTTYYADKTGIEV